MTRIGVLSDTHGYLHPRVSAFFSSCDLIIHAGDIGSEEVIEKLAALKPLKAVYGNIDGGKLRIMFREVEFFQVEDVKILLTHIGGYPPKYNPKAKQLIRKYQPDIFIAGHSHILKVMYDQINELLYINPGAAGKSGFHKNITFLRFVIDGKEIKDLEVFDVKRS